MEFFCNIWAVIKMFPQLTPLTTFLFKQEIQLPPLQTKPLKIFDSISELTENSIYRELWQRYLCVEDRIKSFAFANPMLKRIKNWIAQAGFFYKEEGIIQCFECELQKANWNKRCQHGRYTLQNRKIVFFSHMDNMESSFLDLSTRKWVHLYRMK